ncbi:LTA synthase family protein [Parendozoicomonas haliclonae]|nr:LTA synthase family protein [Parendozoicomonas haliclonae]
MKRYSLKSDLMFMVCSFLSLMALSSLARLLLFYWNSELATHAPGSEIAMGFWVGLRFDLIICSATILPMAFGLLFPRGLSARSFWVAWLMILSGIMILVALVEPVFYDEFHTRLNSIAVQYLNEDPATVISMIINGTPFFTLLIVWAVCLAVMFTVYTWLDKCFREPEYASGVKAWWPRVPAFIVVMFLLAVGFRGGTIRSGAPLRWGDAVHSQSPFANHLALNGVYTFIKAIERLGDKKDSNTVWLTAMENQAALDITRQMILQPEDKLLDPRSLALYRETTPKERLLPDNVTNVVYILMESFSSRFIGAEGDTNNITPYFDALTEEGLLFTRAFSNGTHTHQGMFATFACFPNTPGNEYLMQSEEGHTHFSGYPAVMSDLGYESNAYVYNGAFNWDNQLGFFGNQGITHFVGRDEMKNPKFIDPTWGVSDEDMFNRALEELDALNNKGKPFFAMLQSLSNHMPYAVPEQLEIEPVTSMGSRNERMTAMRYSDWALGEFFKDAKQKPWYNNTLFVLVGDHGFSVNDMVTPVDLLRHHVPVLMIAPGLREAVGATNNKVMSQLDVVPTATSLFGKPFAQHCWGRNILALPENDPGFAIVKPSGNDPLVAFIKGDKVLVKQPELNPELFRYQLGPQPSAQELNEPSVLADMYEQLSAFLQTAMRSLNNKSVGDKPGLEDL